MKAYRWISLLGLRYYQTAHDDSYNVLPGAGNYDGTIMAVTYPVPYYLRSEKSFSSFSSYECNFFEMGGVKSYVVFASDLNIPTFFHSNAL
jgi:hypothetical protein